MSQDYKTITDRLIAKLEAERTDALSRDMSTAVKSVNKGQYVPTDRANVPCVYVRFSRAALKRSIAASMIRDERLKFCITGACRATDQDVAWDDASALVANIVNILEHYPSDTGYWSAGSVSWSYPADNEEGDDYLQLSADSGSDGCNVHFEVYWACDVRIQREAL